VGAIDVLSRGGILGAPEVVEIAAAARLDLAAAATLLIKESSGGRNVWGHDAVPTGGNYVKGAEVTEAAYLRYKAARAIYGAQGVGPTQLTWPAFQDRADARGGAWDWRVNCAVGFEILADHIHRLGTRDGFRAYNGSGPAAERYADDAMGKLAAWRSRLGGGSMAPRAAMAPAEEDLTGEQARQLKAVFDGLTVSGTASPGETVDLMFQRIKRIEAALTVPGTTSAEEAFNLLFARVRNIERILTEIQSRV
jgi:hypothetical protein